MQKAYFVFVALPLFPTLKVVPIITVSHRMWGKTLSFFLFVTLAGGQFNISREIYMDNWYNLISCWISCWICNNMKQIWHNLQSPVNTFGSSHYLSYLYIFESVLFVPVILLYLYFCSICINVLILGGEHDMRKVVPTIWRVLSMHSSLAISQDPTWPTTDG